MNLESVLEIHAFSVKNKYLDCNTAAIVDIKIQQFIFQHLSLLPSIIKLKPAVISQSPNKYNENNSSSYQKPDFFIGTNHSIKA